MILSCGDALIDFVPIMAADGRDAARPTVGGSCLNVAVGIARLGAAAGFIGGISTDLFGRMIAEHAAASSVDLEHATRSEHQTTLAFVRIVAGESQYAFYDVGTASANWTYRRGSISFDAIDAVHVGSTTLVHERGSAEANGLIADAKPTTTISFDPNCRPNLVHDRQAYRALMSALAGNADIIRMSDVDFDYLYGGRDFGTMAASLLGQCASLIVITRGTNGALAWHGKVGAIEVSAPSVDVVDTIGAGDSFHAALLFALREQGCIERVKLRTIGAAELWRAVSFACKCAAITCTRAGADPPRREEITAIW